MWPWPQRTQNTVSQRDSALDKAHSKPDSSVQVLPSQWSRTGHTTFPLMSSNTLQCCQPGLSQEHGVQGFYWEGSHIACSPCVVASVAEAPEPRRMAAIHHLLYRQHKLSEQTGSVWLKASGLQTRWDRMFQEFCSQELSKGWIWNWPLLG